MYNKNLNRKRFYYRIHTKDKNGVEKRHIAEVEADLDENARRIIVHKTLTEDGVVLAILPTDDDTIYPDENNRRRY